MPYPIPDGLNFSITYMEAPACHKMPTMCAAGDFYQVSFLISGDRQCVTPDAIFQSHKGSVIMTIPGLLHQTCSTSNKPYKRILIKISESCVDPIIDLIGKNAWDSLFNLHTHYFNADDTKLIHRQFEDMLYEFDHYSEYTDAILKGMFLRLMVSIKRMRIHQTMKNVTLCEYNEDILKAVTYIDEHFDNIPSMHETAQYIGLADAYFSRLFKKVTGDTYTDYITMARLQYARNMMMRTDYSISKIAVTLGFCNGNHLTSLFKSKFGLTPSEYRKKYGNGDMYPDYEV